MPWPKFPHEYPHTMKEINENPWVEVTADDHYEFLGVVPPEKFEHNGFMVGEPLCHISHKFKSRVVMLAVIFEPIYRRFWAKPELLDRFNVEQFQKQIRAQMWEDER